MNFDKVAITEFAGRVSRYFLDFLETDFKRKQAPRRRITLKNESGFRTAVPLRKYRSLYADIWTLLSKPVKENGVLRVSRQTYKAPISHTLRDLIRQHISRFDSTNFQQVRRGTVEEAIKNRPKAFENPEQYTQRITSAFIELVSQHVVAPILALLDGPVREQAYAPVESIYEIETNLTEVLCGSVIEQLPTALNTYLIEGDTQPLTKVLRDLFSDAAAKDRLKAFFEDFATADAYEEIRDVHNYAELGGESLQLYLYLGDLRFGNGLFPLFYVPLTCTIDKQNGALSLKPELPIYVHKRAIEFLVQELRSGTNTAQRLTLSPVQSRILYPEPDQNIIAVTESILATLRAVFDLKGDMDWLDSRLEMIQSAQVRLSKALYIAAFEKSDESMLNDYEALLSAIDQDQVAVLGLFERIIEGFLIDEPVSVRNDVNQQWDDLAIVRRLVAASPIPLNEEQRKILEALHNEQCRFLAIQGPPGTGKSHTITAIAFDCILSGRNVLILSDKNEALDVVEDKLSNTMKEVRQNDDFPNPILRLGRVGGSYRRLISQSAQEQIRTHYRAASGNESRLNQEIADSEKSIEGELEQTLNTLGAIHIKDIQKILDLEQFLEKALPGLVAALQQTHVPEYMDSLEKILDSLAPGASAQRFLADQCRTGLFRDLLRTVQSQSVIASMGALNVSRDAISLFRPLSESHYSLLAQFIAQYDALRRPIIGYLFQRRKLRSLDAKLVAALPCNDTLDLYKRLADLRQVYSVLRQLLSVIQQQHLPPDLLPVLYAHLVRTAPLLTDAHAIRVAFEFFDRAISKKPELLNAFEASGAGRPLQDTLEFVRNAIMYRMLWQRLAVPLANLSPPDYVGKKTRLEELYTSRMALAIDKQFITFVDTKRAMAKTLGGVISARQQFPQDTFDSLKEAFPVIIAGIREFAEYVPLREAIFDVVVIDEASQVSVAQAFPAILRAKKIIVLGDQKQFANIKSSYASIAMNQGYVGDLDAFFRAKISNAADRIQRLKMFDVKKSVLEFVDLAANYSDMLRKHFRGYAELISFSSKYFYNGQLQAIKIRAKPIEDVIRFTIVESTDKPEEFRNVNSAEANFILAHLKELLAKDDELTVGIITPFREQQEYLSRIILHDTDAARFESEFKIKIMTFDTCQGEERDLILYSMVATTAHDVLNYVFPVSLENAADRIEEAIKIQRLNVGLSRARECVHFVLSKPVEMYRGSIGRALAHYQDILHTRAVPDAADTDPASPMEAKVLGWLLQTPFFQTNEERVELTTQFPVGEYLKQLDPTYHYPSYRTDFLLQFRGEKVLNIIIEYDGLQDHFLNPRDVHAGNYDLLYRPEDLERQFVIESYGYKFLRINRFNLGADPVAKLSERLERLVNDSLNKREAEVLGKIKRAVTDVQNGDGKYCAKCEQIKSKEAFFDSSLQSGKGGYGRICNACKEGKKPPRSSGGKYRRYGRRW